MEMIRFPFDPVERAQQVESLVLKEGKRLYHRFRAAPYYGGIATADAVGCSFLCAYCWNYYRNLNPALLDRFYSPQQVAAKLLRIAERNGFHLFRITGSEPILGEASLDHLMALLERITKERQQFVFILETNGFFLGYRPELVKRLTFRNLWVRVCLKGVDEETFESISGAKKEFFPYPLRALKKLEEQGLKAWPAVMRNLFEEREMERLRKCLSEQSIRSRLEEEVLEGYPFVLENMRRRGVPIRRL